MNAFVSRVNLRIDILIVKFWRSTSRCADVLGIGVVASGLIDHRFRECIYVPSILIAPSQKALLSPVNPNWPLPNSSLPLPILQIQ